MVVGTWSWDWGCVFCMYVFLFCMFVVSIENVIDALFAFVLVHANNRDSEQVTFLGLGGL